MVGIIIQVRMNSSRLPGKIIKKIGSKTLLEHILYRVSLLKHKTPTVLATTVNPIDDVIEAFCRNQGIECFRGSEADVLERYYLCAKKYGFEQVVRLTGDNPFIDIEELDRLIDLHFNKESDYSHSFGELPIGVGAEIFSFQALEKSHMEGTEENHREHVNEYIHEHPELFETSVLMVPDEKKRLGLSLTVDTEKDLLEARRIMAKSGKVYITTKEAIELCSQFV